MADDAETDPVADFVLHHDFLVQDIADFANRLETAGLEVGVPITLFVGGALVSGMAIGARAFFKRYGQSWATLMTPENQPPNELAKAMLEKFDNMAEAIYSEIDSRDERPAPSFIHLRDASVFHPTGVIPGTGGTLMRFRISRVDGFILGELRKGPPQK
jgi:hypothetical protein